MTMSELRINDLHDGGPKVSPEVADSVARTLGYLLLTREPEAALRLVQTEPLSVGIVEKVVGSPELSYGHERINNPEELTIRRPILKDEFDDYISRRIKVTEKKKRSSQKGIINRTWAGFERLQYPPNSDSVHSLNPSLVEDFVGVPPPTFQQGKRKLQHGNGSERKAAVPWDHPDGLDMDQTAKFLLGISAKIEERHRNTPLRSFLADDEMRRILPKYSFVGCKLLCDFIIMQGTREGQLPLGIDLELLRSASRRFGVLSKQTHPQIILK